MQVQLSPGLSSFTIAGLADKARRRKPRAGSRRTCIDRPGASPKLITVSPSSADLPKEGSHHDLPIALGLLAAIGATDVETLSHYAAVVDPALACSGAPRCPADYQARVSGPLLDRIDLRVDVQGVSAADLTLHPPAESRREVADWVARARSVRSKRYNGSGVRTNFQGRRASRQRRNSRDEPGASFSATRRRRCGSLHADSIACFGLREPSPISPVHSRSGASMSPKRSAAGGKLRAPSCALETKG